MGRMMGADSWTALTLGSLWLSYRRHGSCGWEFGRRDDRSRAGILRESAGHLRAGIATGLVVVVAVAVAIAAVVAVYRGGRCGLRESGTKSSPVAMNSLPVGYT